MSQTPRLVLKSICVSGAALIVWVSISCCNAMSQKYAAQSDKKSSSKSYATGSSRYSGNSYAQSAQRRASSYASSGSAPSSGTSYANSAQRQSQTPSYASSVGAPSNGTSYVNRGTSYVNSLHIKLGTSTSGSLLGIMHGAPATKTRSDFTHQTSSAGPAINTSNIRPNSVSGSRTSATGAPTTPTGSAAVVAGTRTSIFSKLRKNY